jgi:hypothetical protein
MPIDPEKLRGGADGTQINVRVSDDVATIIDYLRFVDGQQSNGAWLLHWVGAVIETEAPHIRKSLEKPEITENGPSRLTETLEALDRLCPTEESAL